MTTDFVMSQYVIVGYSECDKERLLAGNNFHDEADALMPNFPQNLPTKNPGKMFTVFTGRVGLLSVKQQNDCNMHHLQTL